MKRRGTIAFEYSVNAIRVSVAFLLLRNSVTICGVFIEEGD
jgi:hypothetical protein